MQPPAGIDGGVGNADFLDLFQIEKSLTVQQIVQGHDPQRRLVRRFAWRGTIELVSLDRVPFLMRQSQ